MVIKRAIFGSKLSQRLETLETLEDSEDKIKIINDFVRAKDYSAKDYSAKYSSAKYISSQIHGLKNSGGGFDLAEAWLLRDERSVEDLKSVLKAVLGISSNPAKANGFKLKLVKAWIVKEDTKDLMPVLSLFDDEDLIEAMSKKSEVINLWLSKDQRTADDFEAFLPLVLSRHDEESMEITHELLGARQPEDENPKISPVSPMSRMGGGLNRAQVFLSKGERTAEDFEKVLPFITEEDAKFATAKTWITNSLHRNEEDVEKVINLFPDMGTQSKLRRAFAGEAVLSEPEELVRSLEEKQGDDRKKIIRQFLAENDNLSSDQALSQIMLLPTVSDRADFAKTWLIHNLIENKLSADDIVKIMPDHYKESTFVGTHKANKAKMRLAQEWVSKDERSADDLVKILPLTEGIFRNNFSYEWLKEDKRSADDLVKILPLTEETFRNDFSYEWLKKME